MDSFEEELKREFLAESEDLLANAEKSFLRLESERENRALLDEIFRIAHNLKGTSKAVGFNQLSELTHAAENLILKLKDGSLKVSDQTVTVLLAFKDQVNIMIEGLRNDFNRQFNLQDVIKQIQAAMSGEDASPAPVAGEIEIELNLTPAVPNRSSGQFEDDETAQPTGASSDMTIVEETFAHQASQTVESGVPEAAIAQVANPTTPSTTQKTEDESIRVKLSRIDKLTNMVGELVILQTVLDQRRFVHIRDDLSNKSISQMAKLFKEVQEITMSLRMMPLRPTFQKMSRIVRDTSKVLNKKARLDTVGDDTEVDKTVLEYLSDPLVHIVRNAVDHGLEVAEERVRNKKPPEGVVTLKAFHEGSQLVIQISDDGKGINPEILYSKAVAKGLIRADSKMSKEQILRLIFHPGFSTKEQVSEVSGRGVGMDVVKTNIEQLGGEVSVDSEVGHGSTIKITLPLTLAIIDGLIVTADSAKYVIPMGQVYELHRADRKAFTKVTGGGTFFTLRGEVLPLFYLNTKLGKSVREKSDEVVIIVRGGRLNFGLVVEDVLNQQQIVIKRLGEEIALNSQYMGSAILGDGKPAFILDIMEMYKGEVSESNGFSKLAQSISAMA